MSAWRSPSCSVIVLWVWLDVQVKFGSSDSLVDVKNIQRTCLEVTGGVVTLGDVKVLSGSVINWLVDVAHLHELLNDWSEEVKSWLYFLLWFLGLHGG